VRSRRRSDPRSPPGFRSLSTPRENRPCCSAQPAPSPASSLHRADIILKYDGDEARSLKTYGELPDTVQINAGTEMLEGEEFGDDNFDFDEDADDGDGDGDFDNI